MKRTVAAVALIGLSIGFSGARAGPPAPPLYAPPHDDDARANAFGAAPFVVTATSTEKWTEPGGSFSFSKPRSWRNVDTASEVGAPVLVIVSGDDDGECWFTRVPRADTAALTPAALIAARSQPLTIETWQKVGAGQHLLAGVPNVTEMHSLSIGMWPVQTAWYDSGPTRVFGALHSRPGLDVWAFCAARDGREHEDLLRQVALSVTTPQDRKWERAPLAPP